MIRPRLLVVAVVASAALALTSCGALPGIGGGTAKAPSPTPTTLMVSGALTLHGSYNGGIEDDSKCSGSLGYDDIAAGAQVVIADSDGKTVALGQLNDGFVASDSCIFTFVVRDVPKGNRFYSVEVSHRGGVQFSEAQLREPLLMTLGSS